MVLKVNNVTNLADARYCAAMGVAYLTFNMERGSLSKVSEALVLELAPWIAGSQLVIHCGKDETAAEASSHALAESIDVVEIEWELRNKISPDQAVAYTLHLQSLDNLGTILEELQQRKSHYLELRLSSDLQTNTHLQKLSAYDLKKIIFHVDNLDQDFLKQIRSKVYGFALDENVRMDLQQLDYDKFEEWIDKMNS